MVDAVGYVEWFAADDDAKSSCTGMRRRRQGRSNAKYILTQRRREGCRDFGHAPAVTALCTSCRLQTRMGSRLRLAMAWAAALAPLMVVMQGTR